MQIGPKYKICKRLGSSVFEKCQTQKFMLAEERHSKSSSRKGGRYSLSNYGRQLIEKQKVRYTYGISEKQLSRYVKKSVSKQTDVDPTQTLIEQLESRLDNVVYQAGFAVTRGSARQMVSHGHIDVNGERVDIPSYQLKEKDIVSIHKTSKDRRLFENLEERLENHQTPKWITFEMKKREASVVSKPIIGSNELAFNLGTVLEYYSR